MSQPSELPERDPETLELFIEETVEGLQRMEKLLMDAEAGRPSPQILNTLFRDFHTIKGTSGFLALNHLLGLAHVAEDLLAILRDKGAPPARHQLAVLVQVVDALRTLIGIVKSTNDDAGLDVAPLVAALRGLIAESEGGEARVAEPPPVVAAPVAAPVVAAAPPVVAAAVPAPAPPPAVEPVAAAPAPVVDEPTSDAALDSASVRVNVSVLDRLMNLIGELVLARNQITQVVRQSADAQAAQSTLQRLSLVTSDLQEQVMKTRMQPVARVFERIPRMARDLSRHTGKEVTCRIEGNTTEIDRALVEAIRDPVMHMVRNAIDHGIETPADRKAAGKPAQGTLLVRAAHEGGMVVIEISDDGHGIHPQKMRDSAVRKGLLSQAEAARLSDRDAQALVFRPGFSTAAAVTDISGRGVGMDVVRSHVERAGGQVEIDSIAGRGTTIRLKMPLTLAIIPALLVSAGGQRFAIPQVNLLELVSLNAQQQQQRLERVRGAPLYRLRGELLPLVYLTESLHLQPKNADELNIVVVSVGDQRYGLIVDAIHDTEEIVVKPLHGALKRLPCYAGATVLGDGSVVLILEVAGIAQSAGIDASSRARSAVVAASAVTESQPHIVFEAGDGAACAVPLATVARLEVIPSSRIERVLEGEVLQYRDTIIPVVRPEQLLPLGAAVHGAEQSLLVFDFGRPVAMAVTRIIDILDVPVDRQGGGRQPYTLGQQVINGRTTLRLDVYSMLRQLCPAVVQHGSDARPAAPRLLVVDDSSSMRTSLADYLRSLGAFVQDVGNVQSALGLLRNGRGEPFSAVVTDLELPGLNGFDLISAVNQEQPNLPVLAWTGGDLRAALPRVRAAGGDACFSKLDRDGLCSALRARGVDLAIDHQSSAHVLGAAE